MTKRIAVLVMLILSLALLPGCPAGSTMTGKWIMLLGGANGNKIGLELHANGEATSFLVDTELKGPMRWWVNGTHFFMEQTDLLGSGLIYAAEISGDSSSMAGARIQYSGPNAGSAGQIWSATKI